MNTKELLFSTEARQRVLSGITKTARAVRATLGPKGRLIAIQKKQGHPPVLTKDGVTVARECVLTDKYEALGADLIKQATRATNDEAGDGTTTSTVLAEALIVKGMKLVEQGYDSQTLRGELESASNVAVEALKSLSKPVDGNIGYIANISANDEKIGAVITEAIEAVGKDGSIDIKDGVKDQDELTIANGMKLPRGPIDPAFSNTGEQDAYKVEYQHAKVLVTDIRIDHPSQLAPLYEKHGKDPLIIFSPSISQETAAAILYNNIQQGFQVLPIPFHTYQWQGQLLDIAAYTGATMVNNGAQRLEDVVLDQLGYVEAVTSKKNETILRGGTGDVAPRQEEIRNLMNGDEVSQFQKELYTKRIANLEGKVAVIHVAGATESEKVERKHRYEDASNSVRSALQEGIVPGGGWALLRASEQLEGKTEGEKLLKWAMTRPAYYIAENAGQSGDVVLSKTTDKKGYNARDDKYEDLEKAGIIDPVKVPRLALINAVSIAGVTFTLEGVMVYEDEK